MARRLPNKWAVATVSLGKHPSHTLERKLQAAADHGFRGIELVHADLLGHARANDITPLQSAARVRTRSQQLGLEVLTLNPLKNFEGRLDVSLEDRLASASEWVSLAVAAGAGIVQMPSQFLTVATTGDDAVTVPELRALADLAAGAGVRIAYEAVAFARFNGEWQDALRVAEAVDRPNFGLCLDSFHVHARIWGDARAASGKLRGADTALAASTAELVRRLPRERVLYVQLSDAARFSPPLEDGSELYAGLEVRDARLAWSRGCRPFPLEAPGYFPVADAARAWLLDWGWEGWVSMEGFLRETEREENGPEVMAARARRSMEALAGRLGVEV